MNLNIQLPDHFLEEEIRCGTLISKDIKKVWAAELDLLAQLLKACEKYNLKIVANGGTMLGAVRHKGFIPWDDDIDMAMPRSDYEKLCQIAADEFHYPYFFQTEYTDPGSMRGHAQLQNLETTAVMKGEENVTTFSQGIFVDIFVYDNVPEQEEKLSEQCAEMKAEKHKADQISSLTSRYDPTKNHGLKGLMRKLAHSVLASSWKKNQNEIRHYKNFDSIARRFNDKPTKWVAPLTITYDDKTQFQSTVGLESPVMVDFEFLRIPLVSDYEEALTRCYGNWHEFVKGTSMHSDLFFDPEKSFKSYRK